MKISYAITVCNEFKEIQLLLSFLLENKRKEDEIVVLFDKQSGTSEVWSYLNKLNIKLEAKSFKDHFANWKNYLTSLCSGDYIFQVDADEMISKYCIENLPLVLEYNNIDVLMVPRINTVKDLTQNHIKKWGWNVDEKGWVNFPDYQWRIYKNNKEIKWKNKVHEVLEGYKTITSLPTEEPWCLKHPKTIERQERQNELYSKL